MYIYFILCKMNINMKITIFGFEFKVSVEKIDNNFCAICGDTRDWCPDFKPRKLLDVGIHNCPTR